MRRNLVSKVYQPLEIPGALYRSNRIFLYLFFKEIRQLGQKIMVFYETLKSANCRIYLRMSLNFMEL
jgi:hypothetical protein